MAVIDLYATPTGITIIKQSQHTKYLINLNTKYLINLKFQGVMSQFGIN